MLTLFALGVLLVDLLLPAEWKVVNAWTAFAGLGFSAASLIKLQWAFAKVEAAGRVPIQVGFLGAWVMDPFAIFFCYLFLIAAAITILMSVHYLDVEQEQHGEYYA